MPNQPLGQLDLTGLLATATAIVFEHERNPVAFIQRADACPLKGGCVYKNVIGAVFRLDEAEAFGSIEELHSSVNPHRVTFFSVKMRAERQSSGFTRGPEISVMGKETAGKGRSYP